jgi:hypothetical protein
MDNSSQSRNGLFSFAMLLVLFGLMLTFLYLSLFFVKWTLPFFFGIADANSFVNSVSEQIKNPLALIYIQAVSSSIGFFLIPAIIYHFAFRDKIASDIGLNVFPPLRVWLLAIGIMFFGGIFIQLLVQINSAIPLPGKWATLRSGQEQIEKILDAFFSETTVSRFLLLTLVMAVLPAVAEEFCFRGTIQRELSRTGLGNGGAIIISGLTFSLMHFEFNNLMAIWCMGIILGCLYYYSGSIWVNIVAHFFNNFIVVVGKFAYLKGFISADMAGSDTLPLYVTLPAGLFMIGGLMLLRKWSRSKPSMLY